MPEPISVAITVAPWLYKMLKSDHQCIGCKCWKMTITRVSGCCKQPVCDGCLGRWLIRRNGVMCCPNCGNEYA